MTYKIALLQKRKYHKGDKKELSKLYSTGVALALEADILTPLIPPSGNKNYDLMINWGLSGDKTPKWAPVYFKRFPETLIANDFPAVEIASNKLEAFKAFQEWNDNHENRRDHIPFPKFFVSMDDAAEYLSANSGNMIFCRQLLRSHSGSGIVVATNPSELVVSPLYTARFPKRWEFRLHVAFGRVIRIQQKKKLGYEEMERRGIPQNNGYIRNTKYGYVFSTQVNYDPLSGGVDRIQSHPISIASINAVEALGLTFGAVDVGVHKEGEFTIFEVNTSPGLEDDSVLDYVNAFRKELGLDALAGLQSE